MIFFYFILLIIIIECAFCSIMKNRNVNKNHREVDDVNVHLVSNLNNSFISKLKKKCFELADACTFILFKVTGYIPFHFVRNMLYKYIFKMNLDKNVVIYYGLEARCPWNIKIGEGSIIGDKVIFDARCGIEIGENVNISTGVWMWTLQHDVNSPTFTSEGTGEKIIVGNRAWVSSRSTVLPGCSIAEGVVVASGAVLTKSIHESFSIWGGVPARKIGNRNKELTYTFNGQHRPFI